MDAMRDRIEALVRDFPGLHLREVARQADTSLNLVQYHVQALQDAGAILVSLDGGKVRVFPPGLDADVRRVVGALRDKPRLRIVMSLLEEEPLTHGVLAKRLKIGKSTLSFHLGSLVESGLLVKDQAFRLADAPFVRRCLDQYGPTPDMVDRIGDLWRRVYG